MVKPGFTEASRHHLDALSQGVLLVEGRLPRGIGQYRGLDRNPLDAAAMRS